MTEMLERRSVGLDRLGREEDMCAAWKAVATVFGCERLVWISSWETT